MCGCNLNKKKSTKVKFDFKRAAAKTGGLAVGAIAADKVSGLLPSSLNPKVKSGLLLVAGAALSAFSAETGSKVSSKTIISSIGDGMTAVSANNLFKAFTSASVEGIGADDVFPEAGYVSDPSVSGDDDDINGIGDDDDINGLDNDPGVYGLDNNVARIL